MSTGEEDHLTKDEAQRIVGADYELESFLAQGASGEVWLARTKKKLEHPKGVVSVGGEVAIKVYKPTFLSCERNERERIKNEFKAGRELNHANLVAIYELNMGGERPLLIMERIFGGDLLSWLSAIRVAVNAYPPGASQYVTAARCLVCVVVEMFYQIVEGVAYLHINGRVHRDLKPANVLVGPGCHALVTDFGVNKPILGGDFRSAASDRFIGTIRNAAPECLSGEQRGDFRSDFYGLGTILFALLTGNEVYATLRKKEDIVSVKRDHEIYFELGPGADKTLTALADLGRSLLKRNPDDRPGIQDIRRGVARLREATGLHGDALHSALPLLCAIPGQPQEVFSRDKITDREIDKWAFAIVTVVPTRDDTIILSRKSNRCTLSLNLSGQMWGIVRNDGKKRLNLVFASQQAALQKASDEVHRFLLGGAEGKHSWRSEFAQGCEAPLRWASAGVLPIANHLGRDWAVLFFRSIKPKGWNVCNGASETHHQCRNPKEIIDREFAEELILLESRPAPGQKTRQMVFTDKKGNPLGGGLPAFREFTERHAELRKTHDDMTLWHDLHPYVKVDDLLGLKPGSREFTLTVSEKDLGVSECKNVIFSLNPADFGIEAIRLYRFTLNDNEWLQDGEISPHPSAPVCWLVRRPIALLSVDFLRHVYRETKSLGEPIGSRDAARLDCKELPAISESEFKLFLDFADSDLDWRDRRLKLIESQLEQARRGDLKFTEEEEKGLSSEYKMIRDWWNSYGERFQSIHRERVIDKGECTTLLPVTWKTLEAALEHRLL